MEMTEPQPIDTDDTAESLSAVIVRHFELLLAEVRRQGRASIAAQAAAESCADAVVALREDVESLVSSGVPGPAKSPEDVVRAILPFCDALERTDRQARETIRRRLHEPGSRSLLVRLIGLARRPLESDLDLRVLADGLSVLRAQLEEALGDLGVTFDRRTGVPVHTEEHHVVEMRPSRAGDRPDTVAQVIRAGCEMNGRRVREADVVVFSSTAEDSADTEKKAFAGKI